MIMNGVNYEAAAQAICDHEGYPWVEGVAYLVDYLVIARVAVDAALRDTEKRWHCEQGYAYYGPCEPGRGVYDSKGRPVTGLAHRHDACGWYLFVGPLDVA